MSVVWWVRGRFFLIPIDCVPLTAAPREVPGSALAWLRSALLTLPCSLCLLPSALLLRGSAVRRETATGIRTRGPHSRRPPASPRSPSRKTVPVLMTAATLLVGLLLGVPDERKATISITIVVGGNASPAPPPFTFPEICAYAYDCSYASAQQTNRWRQ